MSVGWSYRIVSRISVNYCKHTLSLFLSPTPPVGDEFADDFAGLLVKLEKLGMIEGVLPTINDKIRVKIHEGLISKLGEMLPQKMAENGVNIDCAVLASAEQADYFFDMMDKVNKMKK
jgi:hypothetical protein